MKVGDHVTFCCRVIEVDSLDDGNCNVCLAVEALGQTLTIWFRRVEVDALLSAAATPKGGDTDDR